MRDGGGTAKLIHHDIMMSQGAAVDWMTGRLHDTVRATSYDARGLYSRTLTLRRKNLDGKTQVPWGTRRKDQKALKTTSRGCANSLAV